MLDNATVTWTPITDWQFYAVAVPAVLLFGISKSGFGTGFGSLAVPLMALVVSVPQAAAIMMPLLLVMDLMGVTALRRDVDRPLLRFLVPWALVGVLAGALLFSVLDARRVAAVVGIVTLAFLAQRLLRPPGKDAGALPRWVGRILVALGGFTSFIAHAGGPPLVAYLAPLRLAPVVFTATTAWLLLFVNLSKWLPYAWLGLLDWTNFATSVVLMPLTPLGVWLGVRLARRIDPVLFYRLIHLGMFLTGCKLVWDGFA